MFSLILNSHNYLRNLSFFPKFVIQCVWNSMIVSHIQCRGYGMKLKGYFQLISSPCRFATFHEPLIQIPWNLPSWHPTKKSGWIQRWNLVESNGWNVEIWLKYVKILQTVFGWIQRWNLVESNGWNLVEIPADFANMHFICSVIY